ncbi:MAG: HipA domain-containing protein [Halopseudomonas sabulinigri]
MAGWTPISKAYVFTQLKGEYVAAGVLAESHSGFRFAYAQSWKTNPEAYSLDPLNLPLGDQEFSSRKCWGCLLDAGADNWGQRVLMATHRQVPANQIEWLISARGTGVGSVVISASRNQLPTMLAPPDFALVSEMMVQAEQLIQEGRVDEIAALPEHIQKALVYGSSMGGARPKFTVADDGSEWICKLSRSDDTFNQPIAEMASLNMATDCGLTVPRHKLHMVGGRSVLMIERFDRDKEGFKRHYLSSFALLNPNKAIDGDPEGVMSYIRIADVIGKVSAAPAADRKELFTRMVLNVAVGNTDDHLRNHGFLHVGGERYRLSPVFDVLPHPKQITQMALSIGRDGREASLENALSMHERFGLSRDEAIDAIDNVTRVTQNANQYFVDAGASKLEAGVLHKIAHDKLVAYAGPVSSEPESRSSKRAGPAPR